MPTRPRPSKPRSSKKPKGPPVFGPERPPAVPRLTPTTITDSSPVPHGQEGEGTTQEAAEQLGEQPRSAGGKKKRNAPRKKLKSGTGFEESFVETPLHEEDEGRYDSTLPFDQRMLRAIEEWRSLRALPLDRRLAVDSMLKNHFEMDVIQLRNKYGRQSLRGYSPDEPESDEEVDSDAEGEDPVTRIIEIDEESEGVWANEKLDERLIASWLDNRANDGYTPILTTAPQVMGNFLRFLALRDVLPQYKSKLRQAAALCEHAKLQMPSAGALAKQLPTPFHKSLATLFPSPTSVLLFPIPEHDAPIKPTVPMIPDILPAAAFVSDTTDLDLDLDTQPIEVGWPSAEGEVGSAVEEQKRRLEEIKKGLEQEARAIESWKEEAHVKVEDATAEVKAKMRQLGRDVEAEGSWHVEITERSARAVIGWEAFDSSQSDTSVGSARRLVRIDLSRHLSAFPLNAFPRTSHPDIGPAASLDLPLSLYVDLPTSTVKHLGSSPGLVFEADLTKIVFAGNPANLNEPIWFIRSLHRVVPSYWAKIGESLRDEPGRQKDFDGDWNPPEGYEKHWQERDGLPGVVGSIGEGPEQKAQREKS